MKKFQSYEQFEAEFKKESIPELDLNIVKSEVIGLWISDKQVFRSKRKMIAVIAVLVLTLCFGTVAMALYNGWQLKNQKGKVVLDYVKGDSVELSKTLRSYIVVDYKIHIIEDETLASLAPGETSYFLIAKTYEISKYFDTLQKKEKIYDLKELRESTTTKFKVPQYLPGSYKFEYGIVTFKGKIEDEKLGETLYQQAKDTNEEYLIKRDKLTKEAKQIELRYINADGYYLVIYINDTKLIKAFDYDANTIEKFSVSDKEVLYITSHLDDTEDYVFVDEVDSQNLAYFIRKGRRKEVLYLDNSKTKPTLPKKEATKMIESLK